MKKKSAIILPLKESFSNIDFGAVSICVNHYLKYAKKELDYIFCKEISGKNKYLNNNVIPIKINSNLYTNLQYIKKISRIIKEKNLEIIEIHNRPEYAFYLFKNNPEVKINLIFHNDPNKIRFSNKLYYKKLLLENCNKIIFVSNWVKKSFFKNLDISHKNNTEVIYNFINPIKKFPQKKKIIIFSGKLNSSKGYNIFGEAIIKILNKYKDWSALVYGNELREKIIFSHARLKVHNWINHSKLLKIFEKASISVVNPVWDEPFGRTALESSSRGCAVITSKSGGLSETFKNNIILKKNNSFELINEISKLIENNSRLKKIQMHNFKNVIHTPTKSVKSLDNLRLNKKINISFKKKNNFRILHISNFGIRNNHRLFNISIAKKISNGFIRNGHDVIDFDYRSHKVGFFNKNSLDSKILSVIDNYKPNLLLLGHNNSLSRNTLLTIRKNNNIKIGLWYEDHVIKGDPNFKNNINLIEKNNDLIDNYFITTSPDIIKTKINKNKISYLPIPVDPNIESESFFKFNKTKDLFFALSHGVNFGKLKKNTKDEREIFINNLISLTDDKIKFNILGLYNEQPKWNFEFSEELMKSKIGLNLSRGGPSKYASSNRIATLMGNGVLTAINEKTKFQNFFKHGEIITYKNENDLAQKIIRIKNNSKELIKRSKLAKKNYFKYFQNTIVADFIIYKIFNTKKKYKYIWENNK